MAPQSDHTPGLGRTGLRRRRGRGPAAGARAAMPGWAASSRRVMEKSAHPPGSGSRCAGARAVRHSTAPPLRSPTRAAFDPPPLVHLSELQVRQSAEAPRPDRRPDDAHHERHETAQTLSPRCPGRAAANVERSAPRRRIAAPKGRHKTRKSPRAMPKAGDGGAGMLSFHPDGLVERPVCDRPYAARARRAYPASSAPSSMRAGPSIDTAPRTTTSRPTTTSPTTSRRSQATSDGAPAGKWASKSSMSL
ncbi:MAG: hypothetical protein QOJ82_330 [Solirubrobacteraceae bacterium]|nr:hypothetical protein [Solirubrobacteraceae bacterium]